MDFTQKYGNLARFRTTFIISTNDHDCHKLVRIRQESAYANTFERILLATKNIAKPYDPVMRQSPQWYFAYTTEPNRMDPVGTYWTITDRDQ